MANYYTATWPRSPFVERLVVQSSEPEVRRALAGDELTVSGPEGVREKQTLTRDEVLATLRDQFGIELTDDELARLPV
jgi:N-hydroxyarylamine O-acetyltransferase